MADAARADDAAQPVDGVMGGDPRLLVEADDDDVAEIAQVSSSSSPMGSPSLIFRNRPSIRAPRSIDSS